MSGRTDLEALVFQMSADVNKLTKQMEKAAGVVDVESRRMEKRMTKAEFEMKRTAEEMGRHFGMMSLAAGTAFGAIVAYSTKAASDAAETANAFKVAFGAQEEAANKFARTYSKEVGRALDETQGQMAKTQLVLTGVGVSAEQALSMTEAIQKRSADIGSLWNVADAEAYQAILSGIAGEAEPLKKFGVALNEAAMKQELLRLGFKGTASDAPEAAKSIARLNIIMKASASADGDAIKTKDGLANSTKRAQAEFRNAAVELGKNFLPMATQAAQAASALLVEFNKMPDSMKLAGLGMLALVAAGGPIMGVISGLAQIIKYAKLARGAMIAVPATAAASTAATAATTGVAAAGGTMGLAGLIPAGILAGGGYTLASEGFSQKELGKVLKDVRKASDEELLRAIKYLKGLPQGRANNSYTQGRILGEIAARDKKGPGATADTSDVARTLSNFGLSPDLAKPQGGSSSGKPKASNSGGKVVITFDPEAMLEVDQDTVVDISDQLSGKPIDVSAPDDFQSSKDRIDAVLEPMREAAREGQAILADSIEGGLWAGMEGGLPGLLQFFGDQLKAAVIRNMAEGLAASLMKGGGAGVLGDLGSLFSGLFGHRAGGGPVMGGQPVIVGERRPELFVPTSAGTIVPQVSYGGGGGNVVYQYVTIHADRSILSTEIFDRIDQAKAQAVGMSVGAMSAAASRQATQARNSLSYRR